MAHHQVNALAGVDIKKPILTGTLYKQAHSHHLSAFNKRFFVLYPKILIYYEHENGFHKDLAKGALEVSFHTLAAKCVAEFPIARVILVREEVAVVCFGKL